MQNSLTIQDVASIFTAIAAVFTAAVTGLLVWYARRGLNQWRETLKGQASFELARKMIVQAYDFRDKYHLARSPMTFSGESANRPKIEGETFNQANSRNESYARFNRFEDLRLTLLQLRTSKIEAKHILNSEIPTKVDPLEKSFRDLAVALRSYFNEELEKQQYQVGNLPQNDERKKRWFEQREKWFETIYGTEGDENAKTIDNAVDKLIAQLEPFLKE